MASERLKEQFKFLNACKYCKFAHVQKNKSGIEAKRMYAGGYRYGDLICNQSKSIYYGAVLNMTVDAQRTYKGDTWGGCDKYNGPTREEVIELERKRRRYGKVKGC